MDDFETAIMISLDPTVSGDLKENANRYCDSVRTTPDAWKFCVDKIYKSNTMQVKFFCFQILQDLILHRHASLSESDRANLKMFLLNWMRDYNSTKQEDTPVKNKYAQLMALVVKTEYPDQWPTFFRDILGLLNGAAPPVVDLFLRIIKAVDDEVVSHELHRTPAEVAQTARIKDAMREGAVVDLVRVWYELLSLYKTSPPSLVNTCLQTVRGYVGWIDISLVVNEKFMGLLFQLLAIRSFAEEVVECLYEIVCKGMEPYAKFNLLKQLNIKSIIAAAGTNDMEFFAKVGKLTDTMGVELLSCMDTVLSTTNGVQNGAPNHAAEVDSMLNEMLALLFKALNSDSIEVSSSVLGFAQLYVNRLKTVKVTASQIEHLQVFLQIIRNKVKYPSAFDFDSQDEEEKIFLDFRKDLTTIYRNILRIIPERAVEFVGMTFNAVNVTPPPPFPDAEVALHLFYQIGEFYPSAATDPEVGKRIEQFFTQTMVSLSTGPLSSHPHPSVSLSFFECVVRYAKYIPTNQPQYLVAVLTAFLDGRGVRHNNLSVRKRVAVSFLQFVRAVRGLLYPYLDSIIGSLQELLAISFEVQKSVPFEEQVNFYEALGVLIGTNTDMVAQQKHTEAMMKPVLGQMEEILSKELYKNDIASGKPYYTILLSQTINVITTFSKGFVSAPKVGGTRSPSPSRSPSASPSPSPNGKSHQQSPSSSQDSLSTSPPSSTPIPTSSSSASLTPSRMVFAKAVEVVLRIPAVLSTHEELRDKTFTFLHRMIEVLGQAIFPVLPSTLALLLSHSCYRVKDVQDFISLTNQVTARFKETVFGLINDMLMPFVRKMFELLNPATPPTPQSEEARELLELQKAYYAFLQQTLSNNLSGVFSSPNNAPHFQQILNTVVQGCSSKDAPIQKVCVSILRRMAEEWGGVGSFTTLLFEQIVPRLFEAAATLDRSDAMMNAILGDIAKVQKIIHAKTGQAYINFLAQVYLPSIKCPPDAAQQFVQHLDKTPIKQFTDIFKEFTRVFINLRTS